MSASDPTGTPDSTTADTADATDTAAQIAALRAEVARLTAAAEARPAGDDPAAHILHEASTLLTRAEGLIRANPALAVALATGLGFLAGLAASSGQDDRPDR